jgi:hypothetical protein
MAAMAGTMRRLEAEKGAPVGDKQAVVWVSLRPPKEMFEPITPQIPIAMDNANLGRPLPPARPPPPTAESPLAPPGCVYVHLPTSTATVKDRLSTMSARIRPLTQSVEPLVANRLLCFLGTLPAVILTKV